MIFDKKGKIYSKMEYVNEEEIENVVINNFNLLFDDYSILLEKSLINTNSGKGSVPDGIIINFQENKWYILEVELGRHGTWEHIAPQISKQITAMENIDTKAKIAENCIQKINKNSSFKDLLNEIDIEEINIHGKINKILKSQPIVAIPIDFIPNDLNDWTKTLKVEVIVWIIEKYVDINGNVLFSIPEKEIEIETNSIDANVKIAGDILTQVIDNGLLTENQELYFEYGPKGKPKTKFTGIVRKNGIEVDGEISSVSVSSLRCIQKISPSRTTSNGWVVWKTKDGKLINELYKKLSEIEQS
jgi:hypothetical protein